MTRSTRHRARLLGAGVALSVATVWVPPLADAADQPKRGTAKPGAVMTSEVIQSPAIPAETQFGAVRKSPPLVLRKLPATGTDKGSSYTDASLDGGISGELTSLERAKLDQARAAVERARLAGMLYRPLPSIDPLPMNREEMEAAKLGALEARQTPRVTHDPAAGLSKDIAPVQLRGPEGLSALERAKLEAVQQGRPVPSPKPVATPSRRVPSRDAATPKNGGSLR